MLTSVNQFMGSWTCNNGLAQSANAGSQRPGPVNKGGWKMQLRSAPASLIYNRAEEEEGSFLKHKLRTNRSKTVPYKSRQGQQIKEDLSLSSKKELSISITNSPLGWIIIRFTEYFPGEKGTLASPPPTPADVIPIFFLSLLLLYLYWLFSAEDGNLQSIAAQEVQNVPVIFALLKWLLSFTTTFFHKLMQRDESTVEAQ